MSSDDTHDDSDPLPLHPHLEPDEDGLSEEERETERERERETSPSTHELPSLQILYNEEDEIGADEEGGDPDDGRRAVLITGAAGNIGGKLREAWQDIYDLVLIDRDNIHDDPEIIVADLAEWDDDWITHFHGVDTVIHLAGNPDEFAPWEELLYPNLDALANVFHAAVLAGVERIIFASSNHVMGEYRYIEGLPITVELPPKPDGPYGGLKLAGERFGRSMAKAFDMTFIALRLGWVQNGANRPETLPHDWARTHWLSNRDMAHLFECAVEVELDEREYVVANGISANTGSRWDLTGTCEQLGYEPMDDVYKGGI